MPTQTIRLGNVPVTLPDRPGLLAADPADELLLELAAPASGMRVLALGTGPALSAAVALRGAAVVAADHRVHALDAARATLNLNRVPGQLILTTDLPEQPSAAYDLALVNIAFQPNSARLQSLLGEIRRLVRPGGQIFVAGARNRGADTAIKRLDEISGPARLAGYRKGYRAGVARVVAAETSPAAVAAPDLVRVELRGATYLLEPDAGVFAGGLLDPAARLLAEALEVDPSDMVLDLGCGSGILGMVAARLAPAGHAWLVDANAEAVALAQRNLAHNRIANATALASDSIAAVRDRRFDVVVTNPPFHEGRRAASDIGHAFVADAAAVLRPGGRCYLVANRFLPYEPTLRQHFGDVREVAGNNRFKVLRGTR